jgi:hypothetical protein
MGEVEAYNIMRGAAGDRATAAIIDDLRQRRMRMTLAAVRRQLDALATVRGRKTLVLIGPGFLQDDTTDIRDTSAASRRANTALYFIDVRGLQTDSLYSAANVVPLGQALKKVVTSTEDSDRNLVAAGTENMAQDTGGFSVRNSNDFVGATARVADESRAYYLLGIHPGEGKGARNWRKLKVEVTRPGLEVRARRGYTLRDAPPPADDATGNKSQTEKRPRKTLDADVAGALDAAHAVSGVPLRAMAYVMDPTPKDTTRVLVAAEFDAQGLSPKGGAAKLDFSVNITHRDTGRAFESNERLEVKREPGASSGWRSVAREFLLPAGVSSARVVVRDPTSGAMGAVTQRLVVPAEPTFRVSTPILTNVIDESGRKPQAALAVHREFRADGQLFCRFEVLGAAKGSHGPRVVSGMELRAAGGVAIRRSELTPIAPDPDGRLVRLMGMGLSDLQEGRYDLVLVIRDETNGEQIERVEPFTVVSAP